MLGNFNRILRYKGADDVSMTLQRGMPLYEMEKPETVGESGIAATLLQKVYKVAVMTMNIKDIVHYGECQLKQ